MVSLFLCLLVPIFGLIYYLVKKKFNYWTDRGVPVVKPSFPFGNLDGLGYNRTLSERVQECYSDLKSQGVIGGFYFFLCPIAMIMDLDLLRDVLVKDFKYFHSRGEYSNEENDPLSAGLFNLEGVAWKRMRSIASPLFTTSKIKMMHSTLLSVVEKFGANLDREVERQSHVNIQELFTQFTTDVIGNFVLGIDCKSINTPDNPFRRMSRINNRNTTLDLLKQQIISTYPQFGELFKMRVGKREPNKFFCSTVQEIVEYRENNRVPRNDLIQLLISAPEPDSITKAQFASLAVEFFSAGFGNSAMTLTFAAYELALNKDVQEKAREEVQAVLNKHHGVLNYEATMELSYLDKIIKETLRKFPPMLSLRRSVYQTFHVPGTVTVLEKGVQILVPVWAIHRDPAIWPNPDLFDPDRFTEENISKRHPFAYLPFGHGSRQCIGMRLGMMLVKVGLASVLSNFQLSPTEKTPIPMILDPKHFHLHPKGDLFLQIKNI